MMATLLLSLVFFLSGFSALVYQVVWQRVLTIYYGVGAVSITLIVTVFMAGLGLGAVIGGRFADRVRHRLVLYAVLEGLIGLFGLASLAILDFLGRRTAGVSLPWTFLCVSLFLIVPTTLMGMTLPLLTKIYNSLVSDFALSITRLYFINTIGAAVGSLVSAYALITFGGLDTALRVAAAVNGVAAVLILACYRWPAERKSPPTQVQAADSTFPLPWLKLLVFATGFIAIGYEIIWFRVLGIMVKESPYAFATILTVYLLGLAAGSLWMSRTLSSYPGAIDREKFLFGMQVLIAAYVLVSFLAFYCLSGLRPFKWLPTNSFSEMFHPPARWPHFTSWPRLARDLFVTVDIAFWPFVFVFPPTFLMERPSRWSRS